ncbi:zf-HC2 domain-containing protein [bacterium]|nr:zf-HC2 domain-containing protein [bacterium]
MKHEEFEAMILDALEGVLVEDRRTLFEAHLQACPTCARKFTNYQRLIGLEAQLGAEVSTVHPAFSVKTMDQVQKLEVGSIFPKFLNWKTLSLATSTLVVATIALLVAPKNYEPDQVLNSKAKSASEMKEKALADKSGTSLTSSKQVSSSAGQMATGGKELERQAINQPLQNQALQDQRQEGSLQDQSSRDEISVQSAPLENDLSQAPQAFKAETGSRAVPATPSSVLAQVETAELAQADTEQKENQIGAAQAKASSELPTLQGTVAPLADSKNIEPGFAAAVEQAGNQVAAQGLKKRAKDQSAMEEPAAENLSAKLDQQALMENRSDRLQSSNAGIQPERRQLRALTIPVKRNLMHGLVADESKLDNLKVDLLLRVTDNRTQGSERNLLVFALISVARSARAVSANATVENITFLISPEEFAQLREYRQIEVIKISQSTRP